MLTFAACGNDKDYDDGEDEADDLFAFMEKVSVVSSMMEAVEVFKIDGRWIMPNAISIFASITNIG